MTGIFSRLILWYIYGFIFLLVSLQCGNLSFVLLWAETTCGLGHVTVGRLKIFEISVGM